MFLLLVLLSLQGLYYISQKCCVYCSMLDKGNYSGNPALINTISHPGRDGRILLLELCMFFREWSGYFQLLTTGEKQQKGE